MIGGASYYAGKRGAENAQAEADQDQRLSQLEAQQYQQAPPQYQQAPPPQPAGGADLTASLQRLADLKQQGVLTDSEFEQAKQKLLSG